MGQVLFGADKIEGVYVPTIIIQAQGRPDVSFMSTNICFEQKEEAEPFIKALAELMFSLKNKTEYSGGIDANEVDPNLN